MSKDVLTLLYIIFCLNVLITFFYLHFGPQYKKGVTEEYTRKLSTIHTMIQVCQNMFTQEYTKLLYSTKIFQVNSEGSWADGNFIAPRAGFYLVNASVRCDGTSGWLILFKNNLVADNRWAEAYGTNTVSLSRVVRMRKNDFLSLALRVEKPGNYDQPASSSFVEITYVTGMNALDD